MFPESIKNNIGGIVLCGGESKRMGRPKATLPFGPELMLQRVVRLLGELVQPLVVVAAQDQTLPKLPDACIITSDRTGGRGPLEGLAAGLTALPEVTEAAYVTGCDVPLLESRFVMKLISLLENHKIVVPTDGKFFHPLAALYRRDTLPAIESLLTADRLRPVFLFDQVDTRRVPINELRDVDPELQTLANLNRPEDYLAALEQCGFDVTENFRREWGQ